MLKTDSEIFSREGNSRRAWARAGQTIVEATAGNTGIGLAIAANRHHLKCKIFAPDGFSARNNYIMIALGAEVSRTSQSEGMHGVQLAARSYAEKYVPFI
ncbi:pyridoxal-phosphate dependent enzyme [Staphylococcus aureus]